MNSLGANLPSLKASNALLKGDVYKVVDISLITLGRAALLAGGIAATGLWSDRGWRNALVGSATIQAFVLGYSYCNNMSEEATLPSWSTADALVRGDCRAILPTISMFLGRAVLLSAGMCLGGERDKLVEQALTASLGIELGVLFRASLENK